MKLSGQATVSSSTDPALSKLVYRCFPALSAPLSLSSLAGLSGQSREVVAGQHRLVARHQHDAARLPGVDRRREYRILRKLSGSGLGPKAWGYADNWLLLAWQPGEVMSQQALEEHLQPLSALLARLHSQPLSGYPLSVLRLLQRYWQLSQPQRRHCGWLRALRRLEQQGEPRPLRRALLHMDVHAGNLIDSGEGLRLIDWEYASDGDIALELAAVIMGNGLTDRQQSQLVAAYAVRQRLDQRVLARQIARWQPWLRLLVACWYELRWQQTQQQLFLTLAAQAWQRV